MQGKEDILDRYSEPGKLNLLSTYRKTAYPSHVSGLRALCTVAMGNKICSPDKKWLSYTKDK